jgi:hypothetical protein
MSRTCSMHERDGKYIQILETRREDSSCEIGVNGKKFYSGT